jgi:hypothetical protein
MERCGAKTRSGSPCQKGAGWGTDHAGEGRCKLHGGASPIRSGRYSVITRDSIRDLVEHFESDESPLDVLPELAHVRALLSDFINRYEEIVDALMAWNAAEYREAQDQKRKPRPQRLPSLEDAILFLRTAAKIAQDEKKLQLENAVSRKDLLRIFTEQRRVLENEIQDPGLRQRILDGFRSIALA